MIGDPIPQIGQRVMTNRGVPATVIRILIEVEHDSGLVEPLDTHEFRYLSAEDDDNG